MVKQHYRWDFIGLSTDTKPTPAESEKVTNGSTFYESDTSKLYVFYQTQWYEKTAEGGGGGTTYTAGDGIDITNSTISVDTDTIQEKLTAGTGIDITNNTISATGGGGGPTVVQTTGTSTTDVMSQNAVTSMVFHDPGTNKQVLIGAKYSSGTNSIAIGYNATAQKTETIAIGNSANPNASNGVAIGHNATVNSNKSYGVALGAGAIATRDGEVNIGTGSNPYGYNNTSYRVLGGVHDGIDAHDAATLGQLTTYSVLTGAGAPTTSTAASYLGQFYYDSTNDGYYYCSAITAQGTTPETYSYTWTALSTGGGGPTVVQTTGTSTTDVMSQNATSSMVYNDPQYKTQILIGDSASTTQSNTVTIGRQAQTSYSNTVAVGYKSKASSDGDVAIGAEAHSSNYNAVAIGYKSSALQNYSIALGYNANTSRVGEVNVGSGVYNYGYNSTKYRVIGGVHDGQLAQDAVTVNQVNSVIDAINTALSTNIPHIGS